MGVGALAFLLGGVGRLEEQDGLNSEKEAGGIEKLLGTSVSAPTGLVEVSLGEGVRRREDEVGMNVRDGQ